MSDYPLNRLSDACKQQGRDAEEVVISWLRRHPQIDRVLDTREDEAGFVGDYDLLCQRKDGTTFTVEIKSDNRIHETGNFPLEVTRFNRDEAPDALVTLAWGGRSCADFIVVYCPSNNTLYIARRRRLQAKFAENGLESGRLHKVRTGDRNWTALCTMPLSELGDVVRVIPLRNREVTR